MSPTWLSHVPTKATSLWFLRDIGSSWEPWPILLMDGVWQGPQFTLSPQQLDAWLESGAAKVLPLSLSVPLPPPTGVALYLHIGASELPPGLTRPTRVLAPGEAQFVTVRTRDDGQHVAGPSSRSQIVYDAHAPASYAPGELSTAQMEQISPYWAHSATRSVPVSRAEHQALADAGAKG